MKPTSINPPIQVCTTREETIRATTDTSKLITNAIKINRNLKGKVPEIFDGDRMKTLKFLNAFELFHMNNEDNSHMKNPYKCCTYFLGLLDGEKVDDWVEEQTDILRGKDYLQQRPHQKRPGDSMGRSHGILFQCIRPYWESGTSPY